LAPLASLSLAGQEHGRTIPLAVILISVRISTVKEYRGPSKASRI
jgi:hypothetical protein